MTSNKLHAGMTKAVEVGCEWQVLGTLWINLPYLPYSISHVLGFGTSEPPALS